MPKFLLLSGCERTGTTIMSTVVNTHPKIRMPGEEGLLMLFVWLWNGLHRGLADEGKPWHTNIMRAIAQKTSEVDRIRFAKILKRVWPPMFSEYSANDGDFEYIGDKYPPYIPKHYELLDETFKPKWLFITRNKKDTLASMRRAWWNRDTTTQGLEARYESATKFIYDVMEYTEGNHLIHYEDLCENPNLVMDGVAEWLGLENQFDTTEVRRPRNAEETKRNVEGGAPRGEGSFAGEIVTNSGAFGESGIQVE